MESVANLAPAPMQQALGGVGAAVNRSVAGDRDALASAPPQATPPAAPTAAGPARQPDAARAQAAGVEKVAPGAPQGPAPAPPPAAITAPLPEVRSPGVTSNADGQLTADDARHVAESVAELPVSDPALNVTVGAAPTLALAGDADPHHADEQRAALAKSTQGAAEEGRRDAAEEMGEHHVVPTVKAEAQRGEIPAAAGAPAGPAQQPAVDFAVAAVARERSSEEVRAAALGGSRDLTGKRTEQQSKMTQARDDSQRDVDKEIADDAQAQRAERGKTLAEVGGQRKEWSGAQRDEVTRADQDADQDVVVARRDVADRQKGANDEAATHYAEGDRKIAAARNDAEKEAREKREQARNESKHEGFFSRIGHAIGSFFDGIRNAIHKAFDFARKLVTEAINAAKKLASAVIDRVRDVVVGLIQKVGEALIAIGDRVLAAFPKLREKFRAAIHKLVDGAVAAVNRLAEGLKKAVKKLLDLLGKALTFILDAYEAIYMAIVNAVASAINTAINAVKAIITLVGVFAAIIKDIASGPGQWLRNLGAALLDGVRNHLWAAFKAAVKEWFNSKVEAVVGIGKLIFEVLRKGGIAFSRIAKMVWVAVKAAIPRAIIEFLIQKVISMLVPAAAAIMAIIEGLQAAWATASRVIAALDQFVTFLKAVKGGNAGPQFAKALAAAAIVVIDFTANFIISKIGKGAKGVGGKLKGIASKLMAWFRRGARAVKRGLQKVGRAIMRGVRAVGRGLRAAGRWIARSGVGRAVRAAARWIANTRVGKAIARGWAAAKKKVAETRERIKKWWENRKKNKEENDSRRLAQAVAAITPKLQAMLDGGVSGLRLKGTLLGWRILHRIKRLEMSGDTVVAANSPPRTVVRMIRKHGEELRQLISIMASRLLGAPEVRAKRRQIEAQRKRGAGTKNKPIRVGGGTGLLGVAVDVSGKSYGTAASHGEHLKIGDVQSIYFQQRGSSGEYQPYLGRIGTYGEISQSWKELGKTTGLDDAELARELRSFIKTGSIRRRALKGSENSKLFARMSVLMGSIESGRSHSVAAETAMMLSLVEAGKAKPQQVFGVGSTRNPALSGFSGVGAVRGQSAAGRLSAFVDPSELDTRLKSLESRHAEQREIHKGDPAKLKELDDSYKGDVASAHAAAAAEDEVERRQLALVERYVLYRMEATGEYFNKPEQVGRFVERELKKLFLATYGVRIRD
jgi:hypothetical protein